ncbi:hypothetical protein [Oleiharenicola lentus]|uniref:hypothetical protein n=1 Tax=Oleiharenicola lentus TaxID=2508720 RepID=UPI003F6796C0
MKSAFTQLKQLFLKTVLLGLIPFSASAATVINETFATSPAANFTVVSGGTWAVSSGRYVLTAPANSTILGNLSRHNTSVAGDFTLTTTVRTTGTAALWDDTAVVFNYSNASNYYFVSLNEQNDGATNGIFKVQAGVQTELADFAALSTANTDYTIEIVRAGSSITVKRNGTTLGTATDSSFTSGYVGYGSKNDGGQFDNLLVNTPSGDTTPPTAPGSLIGAAVSSSQINLSWNASTDNVGVTGYNVYRGGSLITTVAGLSHSDTGLTASTSYSYKVKARDAANNLSADSNTVNVSTLSGSTGAPVEVSSFGPNGTHWPSATPTPFLYDTSVPNIINVACSWSAISTAISGLTPAQVTAGVLILVAPGDLPGNGSGSSSTPVIQNVGSTSWTKRVTVAPRDGYGTVTIGVGSSIGARIHNVSNVCFAGFIAYGLRPSACNNLALAWTKVINWLGLSASTNMNSTNLEIVEVVLPEYSVRDTDAAESATSTNGTTSGFKFVGCYIAPRYRSNGSAHTDSLQFFGSSSYSNMSFKDTVIFSSSNCAIQTGGLNGLELRHCYIAAQGPALYRYPFPGGYTPPNPNDVTKTFNGGGTGFKAYDSIFIGGMPYSTSPWVLVSNTTVSASAPLAPGATGAWTVNASLTSTIPEDFDVPLPTDAYLNSIWQ